MTELSIHKLSELLEWRTILDILLITFIFYSIHRLLRDTGTWKILLGIVIAAAFFFVARLLDLQGIQWIYSTLSPVIVVSLIIIFQPEIRRILEKTASLNRKHSLSDAPELVRILSRALFDLAERNWGAIVVCPGRDSILPWTSKGIFVNAVPSEQLLMSIFDPHSDGHDGAVIVENGRIVRFGVRLPLSSAEGIDPSFGMRHQAALGLAEKTDAQVIAVSEERGSVIVFSDNRFVIAESQDGLAALLAMHLQDKTSYPTLRPKGFSKKKMIIELLGSILLAALFWLLVIK